MEASDAFFVFLSLSPTRLEQYQTAAEALATLGLLLVSAQPPSRRIRCVLAVIPVLSLLVGAATLWLVSVTFGHSAYG